QVFADVALEGKDADGGFDTGHDRSAYVAPGQPAPSPTGRSVIHRFACGPPAGPRAGRRFADTSTGHLDQGATPCPPSIRAVFLFHSGFSKSSPCSGASGAPRSWAMR